MVVPFLQCLQTGKPKGDKMKPLTWIVFATFFFTSLSTFAAKAPTQAQSIVVNYDEMVRKGFVKKGARMSGCYSFGKKKQVEVLAVRPENWTRLCGPNRTARVTTETVNQCCERDDSGNCTSMKQCKQDVADCEKPEEPGTTYKAYSEKYSCTECSSGGSTSSPAEVVGP